MVMPAYCRRLLVFVFFGSAVLGVVVTVPSAHGSTVGNTGGPVIQQVPADSGTVEAPLEARLQAIYDQVDHFQNIRVSVRDGVVHLTGAVVQARHATDAEELARTFDEVVYVVNDISAESDLSDRVEPALSRLQRYGTILLDFWPVALLALLIVVGTVAMTRIVGRWDPPERVQMSPLAWGMVRRVIQFIVTVIGLVITFDLLGVTSLVGALLGTAGVAGLVIGFAFRDIMENYLAGVLLSLRQPFRVNDVVSIDEYEGRVVRLTSREVVLLTFDGNHVRLPNAHVFKSVLVNYTQHAKRLLFFDVGVGVKEDLLEVKRLGIETLDAMNGILPDPAPFARIRELGDSTVLIRFHGWVDQDEADFFKVKSEALRLVKQALDEADVEMPEPTYRLQLYQAGDVEPRAPKQSGASAVDEAGSIDVVPDRRLEERVEEELRSSDEPNLLSR